VASDYFAITAGWPPEWAQDTATWEALLGRISYRPGWELRVYQDFRSGTMALHVIADVEDTYQPGVRGKVLHARLIPPHLGGRHKEATDREDPELLEAQRLTWIRDALGTVELHERDEWLKVDGIRRWDPHA
jgi:hypothetical protein